MARKDRNILIAKSGMGWKILAGKAGIVPMLITHNDVVEVETLPDFRTDPRTVAWGMERLRASGKSPALVCNAEGLWAVALGTTTMTMPGAQHQTTGTMCSVPGIERWKKTPEAAVERALYDLAVKTAAAERKAAQKEKVAAAG